MRRVHAILSLKDQWCVKPKQYVDVDFDRDVLTFVVYKSLWTFKKKLSSMFESDLDCMQVLLMTEVRSHIGNL